MGGRLYSYQCAKNNVDGLAKVFAVLSWPAVVVSDPSEAVNP